MVTGDISRAGVARSCVAQSAATAVPQASRGLWGPAACACACPTTVRRLGELLRCVPTRKGDVVQVNVVDPGTGRWLPAAARRALGMHKGPAPPPVHKKACGLSRTRPMSRRGRPQRT